MPKFKVNFHEVYRDSGFETVWAKNKRAARRIAKQMYVDYNINGYDTIIWQQDLRVIARKSGVGAIRLLKETGY